MAANGDETEDLLRRAGGGDGSAIRHLLERHRARLRRMVAARLDRRLGPRVDPSDVVQEALADAGRALPAYLRERPVAYYPWLRSLTFRRVVWWYRSHVLAGRRTVTRDLASASPTPGGSPVALVERLVASSLGADDRVVRDEDRARVLKALQGLEPADREVLRLRYFEGLSFPEIADALGTGLSAVKMRHLRALGRFRARLEIRPGDTGR